MRSVAELPGASRLARSEDPPVFAVRVLWSPARRTEACFSWTESLGPRAGIRGHCDAQKWASDLQRYRAAYRNRTDDLRITRVFSCAAREPRACASFMFAGCCWRGSLAVDGRSGASEGHGPVMRRFSV